MPLLKRVDTLIARGPNVIVITGASSGFGAAMAERLAANSTRVVFVARRPDRLAEVASRGGRGQGRSSST
jgi:NADP-dependent 3-hydroxy acid dehydrogenase YdfG